MTKRGRPPRPDKREHYTTRYAAHDNERYIIRAMTVDERREGMVYWLDVGKLVEDMRVALEVYKFQRKTWHSLNEDERAYDSWTEHIERLREHLKPFDNAKTLHDTV